MAITLVVGPINLILCFSESLERGLSDDVLKIKSIFFGLFLTKYHGL